MGWSLNERVRRLEATRTARARSSDRVAGFEHAFALVEYVRVHGRDGPLPEYLVHRDREEEIATLEWLRSSGSGWDTDPDAIALLEAWERDLHA